MNAKDWRQQAAHFDRSAPLVPGAYLLRESGFRYRYIIKDVVLAQALEELHIKRGSKVLDVGCGSGILLDRLWTTYGVVGFGVDVSSKSLRRGRTESLAGLDAPVGDARGLPFADNSFDLAFSLDVLEHIQHPERALREIARVVRPGGRVLCYAISKRHRFTLNWWLGLVLEKLGISNWSRACHDPDLLIEPDVIRKQLFRSGWNVYQLEPFHAFFTILFDQALLASYWIGATLGLFEPRRRSGRLLARGFLGVANWASRAMAGLLRRLDSPWTSRGLSNGFFVVATRQYLHRWTDILSGETSGFPQQSSAPSSSIY